MTILPSYGVIYDRSQAWFYPDGASKFRHHYVPIFPFCSQREAERAKHQIAKRPVIVINIEFLHVVSIYDYMLKVSDAARRDDPLIFESDDSNHFS